MVLLDVVTGLRASELFGLKWADINFKKNEISVTRSIVMQVVGPCKTEASQKPVPLDPVLARTLRTWRAHTMYKAAGDWVFASPYSGPKAVLVPVADEESHSRGCTTPWHHQEDWVAYVPSHLRHSIAGEWSGHQGCPGAAPSCVLPRHA